MIYTLRQNGMKVIDDTDKDNLLVVCVETDELVVLTPVSEEAMEWLQFGLKYKGRTYQCTVSFPASEVLYRLQELM